MRNLFQQRVLVQLGANYRADHTDCSASRSYPPLTRERGARTRAAVVKCLARTHNSLIHALRGIASD